MNRRNFLRAFVAIAAAPAIELLPAAEAGDLVGIPVVGDSMTSATPIAPDIIFRTSIGDMRFLTTPAMWVESGEFQKLAGPLEWVAQETMKVLGVDFEHPLTGRRQVGPESIPSVCMMTEESMRLHMSLRITS